MRITLSSIALVLLLSPAPASSQTNFEAAVSLYSSAAYEEALVALELLPKANLDAAARVAIDHYRMLCLLALGRSTDAEGVIVSLLEEHPTYRLSPDDASPRVLRVFTEARRRALPGVVQRRYQLAKRLYDERQYEQAAMAFAVVRTLLADGDLATADARVADLGQLAAGFEELCRVVLDAEERRVAEAAVAEGFAASAAAAERAAKAAEVADKAVAAAAPPAAAPVPAADPVQAIYGPSDRRVIPPTIIRQNIAHWPGSLSQPPAGTSLGTIEVIVDETGAVINAVIRTSVSSFYDAVLLDSAKTWRYQPATRDGRPVKYRRVFTVASGN